MPVTKEELDSFHHFSSEQLNNGGCDLSFDDCVRLWKEKREEDLALIRRGVAEADAGLGRPFEEVDAEVCRKFGWSFNE